MGEEFPDHRRSVRAAGVHLLAPLEQDRSIHVIEVTGCGDGQDLRNLAGPRLGDTVIERSQGLSEMARRRVHDFHIRYRTHVSILPEPTDSF
ncbi:hypothetical protein [Granulicoccus phenolivorans]|uniref:hypothetical protein n=1 Tax=Granulicoccus phenolivorans TaxID=266854 RepID=UPI0014702AF5|nr:hypothetical protein [Granulicoccus phenolivorans]